MVLAVAVVVVVVEEVVVVVDTDLDEVEEGDRKQMLQRDSSEALIFVIQITTRCSDSYQQSKGLGCFVVQIIDRKQCLGIECLRDHNSEND